MPDGQEMNEARIKATERSNVQFQIRAASREAKRQLPCGPNCVESHCVCSAQTRSVRGGVYGTELRALLLKQAEAIASLKYECRCLADEVERLEEENITEVPA